MCREAFDRIVTMHLCCMTSIEEKRKLMALYREVRFRGAVSPPARAHGSFILPH